MKLDIGCGASKKEGFTGMDKYQADGVDIIHDALVYPWPFKDGEVTEVNCSHFFEHIQGLDRPNFMDEMYRVMAVGAEATFITPCESANRAIQDFSHAWPPVCPETYLYFNKEWRVNNKLTHGLYDIKCNFNYTYGYSTYGAPRYNNSNVEMQTYMWSHLRNGPADTWVKLTKI